MLALPHRIVAKCALPAFAYEWSVWDAAISLSARADSLTASSFWCANETARSSTAGFTGSLVSTAFVSFCLLLTGKPSRLRNTTLEMSVDSSRWSRTS